MTNHTIYPDQVSVYPGIYERPWSENEFENELHKTNVKVSIPPVQLQHFPDHYRIDIAIPGYNKDCLFIHTKGRMLSITGINKNDRDKLMSDHHVTENNCECVQRNIMLPSDADTDFVTAEYTNGMLRIYLSTTNLPVEGGSRDIIVY